MSISTPGLIGACVGIVLALILYVVMTAAWRRNMNDINAQAEQRERFVRMWPGVRVMLLVDFVILGALGYFAGDILGS
jgi:cell division protein FtsX